MNSFGPRPVDGQAGSVASSWRRSWVRSALIATAFTVSLGCGAASAWARDALKDAAGTRSATVSLSQLPTEARRTEQLIRSGGPFPYAKDGVVFGNRERLLPRQPRGWYREYTVPTPGSRDRGARRIVCGGERPTEPEACFYTEDHYASFQRIAP